MAEPGAPKKKISPATRSKGTPAAAAGKADPVARVTRVTRLGIPGEEISNEEGRSALHEFVGAAKELILDLNAKNREAARLHTYEALEVRRIQAAEDRIRDYFDQVFAERRDIYQGFFERLDRALDERNNEALHAVVTGIVELAKTSPMAQAGDGTSIRAIWNDPSTPFTI